MTFSDDNPQFPSSSPEIPQPLSPAVSQVPAVTEIPPGDPFTYGAHHPQPYHFAPPPADLQIPWSWGHLICFGVFGFLSLVFVQLGFTAYYIAAKSLSTHATPQQMQQFALSRPVFAIGSMVLWYALLFIFLYLTLTLFYRSPFWFSLGWRKLNPQNTKAPNRPWLYLALGCALSIVVMIVTALAKPPEHAPIQDILKNPTMALAFMGMAVLVAPLVEETIFRGYLFPLFAKSFGLVPGILVTGVLFGLMHGYQLGWAWAIVGALIGVGIVFTVVRARAESTFASFLMHLGYNSTIAVLATLGLFLSKYAKLAPPHH
ncbi:MAG TPA: type II CAAX endopeptidase family protein [Candidatus Acidoferrum sp.]|jgi:membrane protease YdiL (CAAX protease family)|nr:type II CAAX endopeptidase family protein [Candidatus Acidoferrum sp.]